MRNESAQSLQKLLKDNMGEILSKPTYLQFMGRFHQYSVENQMLILIQKPEAVAVAGYRRWEELGRKVIDNNEISIITPYYKIRYVKKSLDKQEYLSKDELNRLEIAEALKYGLLGKERIVAGFDVVAVFDISQTVEIKCDTNKIDCNRYNDPDKLSRSFKITGNTSEDIIKAVVAKNIKQRELREDREDVENALNYVVLHELNLNTSDVELGFIYKWCRVYREDEERVKHILESLADMADIILSKVEEELAIDTQSRTNEAEEILKIDRVDKLLSVMEANIIRTKAGGSQL